MSINNNFFKSHPVAITAIVMALSLAPLMAMRDFTPANELRYLSIVDEALAEGLVFTFSNQGEPYADKPPLYFWLMMLLKLVTGHHSMFALSMLSFIPSLVIITVMDKWLVSASGGVSGVSFADRLASSMMLGTSALFLGMSMFLRMDLLMCMFIVLALHTFYRQYTGSGNPVTSAILLPVYIFLALFTKGPVGLLVPPAAILVFLLAEGKIRDAGKYLGFKTWGIIALLCALWFTGVWIEGGRPYLENLLFHQTVDRAVNAFHHKEPFWYYLVTVWYSVAPYSLMLVPAMAMSFFRRPFGTYSSFPYMARSAMRLFSAVSVTTLVMLSAFSSKLAVYLLPVFPFLVYFFPLYMRDRKWGVFYSAAIVIPALAFVAAGAGGAAVLASGRIPELREYGFLHSPAVYAALAVLAAGGIVSAVYAVKDRSWQRPVVSLATSMLVCVLFASAVIPSADSYIGYGDMCRTAESMASGLASQGGASQCRYVTLYVYRPENMDAYLHTDVIDFGQDADGYLDYSDGPHVLMVPTEKVMENERLSRRLSGAECRQSGRYSLYLMPGR